MFSTQPEPDATVQSLFDLTGRVALITGASGYLGKALSFALAEVGAFILALLWLASVFMQDSNSHGILLSRT